MRFRPSILLSIGILGTIAIIALFLGIDVAVVTTCTGGIIALGMRLLEGQNGGG